MKPPRIVVNIFAVVGVLATFIAICFLVWGWEVSGGTDGTSEQARIASPDKTYQAVRYVTSGGGAAGWCNQFVVIASGGTSIQPPSYKQAWQDNLVFSIDCGTEFSLSWETPSQLAIRYHIDSGVSHITSVHMGARDKTQRVTIKYYISE